MGRPSPQSSSRPRSLPGPCLSPTNHDLRGAWRHVMQADAGAAVLAEDWSADSPLSVRVGPFSMKRDCGPPGNALAVFPNTALPGPGARDRTLDATDRLPYYSNQSVAIYATAQAAPVTRRKSRERNDHGSDSGQ